MGILCFLVQIRPFKKDLIEITYLDRLPLVEREYDQASLYLVNQTL